MVSILSFFLGFLACRFGFNMVAIMLAAIFVISFCAAMYFFKMEKPVEKIEYVSEDDCGPLIMR